MYTQYVNVFHGAGEIELAKAQRLAKTRYPFKGMCGNTDPAAVLPFGKYSVCPYSGGYSSGYGINRINYGEKIKKLMDSLRLKGFSHFQNSGTGAIGLYYNYAVVTPWLGNRLESYGIRGESGRPGYYGVTLEETGILCELTVTEYAAVHRYTFPEAGGRIRVDFTNDGLYEDPVTRGKCEDLQVRIVSEHKLAAAVTLQGIRLYFAVSFDADGALDPDGEYVIPSAGSVTVLVSVSCLSETDAWQEQALSERAFDRALGQ